MRIRIWASIFFILCTSNTSIVIGKEQVHQETNTVHATQNNEKGKFNPTEFLFDHISDAHEWHIFTLKDKHYSIPLPIILYSKKRGFVFFNYKKLHHGHSSYKGFRVGSKGEVIKHKNKKGKETELSVEGKIVEQHQNGTITKPLDFSITKNIIALWFSVFLLLFIFLKVAKSYKKNVGKPPKGLQSLLEPIIIFVRDEMAKQAIGHKYEKYTPFLLTIFFFIWFNNMLGLVPFPPGGANLTGNIAITAVLAFFTLLVTNLSGNQNYWKHIFNTPGVPFWLKLPIPVMPIIEAFGILTKPVVLAIRLFANITAGHLITLGFLSLIFVFGEISPYLGLGVSPLSVLFLIFMLFLELLVAFIQAFIFTFLSALYIGMAVEEHH